MKYVSRNKFYNPLVMGLSSISRVQLQKHKLSDNFEFERVIPVP